MASGPVLNIVYQEYMKTDLRYLEEMTEGDRALIKELIGIFSTQVEEYSLQLQVLLDENNWSELSKLAHKAKSSVAIMGMNELAGKLKSLEVLAGEGNDTDSFQELVDAFKSDSAIAVKELRKYDNEKES